jgi:hypothetical protein
LVLYPDGLLASLRFAGAVTFESQLASFANDGCKQFDGIRGQRRKTIGSNGHADMQNKC